MTIKKKNLLILIIIIMATVLAISAVLAVSAEYFTIKINYPYQAGTDTFTLGDTAAYYDQPAVTSATTSLELTVKKAAGGSTTVTAFDLLVFARQGTVSAAGLTVTEKQVTDGKWFIFKNVPYTGGTTGQTIGLTLAGLADGALKTAVVTYREYNSYIGTFFDLKAAGQQQLYNPDDVRNGDAYRNLYLLDDLTVDDEYVINYPCYIDLLYSRLILQQPLTVAHSARGAFEFAGISGSAAIDNTAANLIINAPQAYYRTAGLEALMTTPTNFIKSSDNVDFKAEANATLRATMLSDAAQYFVDCLGNRLYGDVVLPTTYQNYDITYDFTSDNLAVLSTIGRVGRGTATVSVATTVAASLSGSTATLAQTVQVVGTSEQALSDAFDAELGEYVFVAGAKTMVGETQTSNMVQNIELTTFIKDFVVKAAPTSDVLLSTGASNYLAIRNDDTDYVKLEVLYVAGAYSLSFDDGAAVALASVSPTYLVRDQWVLDAGSDTIATAVGASAGTVSITFSGITKAEKETYIERFIETLYFTGTTDTAGLIRFAGGNTYLGDAATPAITSDLGFRSVAYKVYMVTKVNFAALSEGTMTQAQIVATGIDYTSHFTITNGVMAVTGGSSLPLRISETNTLMLTVELVHSDDSDYATYREIKIPANGIGGDEYAEYVQGNTFSDYFDGLDGGRLIDSTADVGATVGTAYRFKADITNVNLNMTIVNDEDISAFCTIVKGANGISQVDIDVANVPSNNTVVQLQAIFYLTDINDPISTQFYSFVIPGVYRCAAVDGDFTDTAFFNRLLAMTDGLGAPLYESFGGYMLADGARADVAELDLTLAAAQVVDVTGINLLSGTRRIILDNNTLSGVAAFGLFEEHNLTYLSLKNCGLTDAAFAGGELRGMQALTEIHLENNSISSLVAADGSAILYRTLTALYLDDQTALSDVSGLGLLPNLATVSLTGNAISVFNPLLDAESLIAAYVADNNAVLNGKSLGDTTTYFGTDGIANISVFVDLLANGVTLYAADGLTQMDITDYSANQISASRILNGIFVNHTQVGGINSIPASLTDVSGNVYTVTARYIVENGTVVADAPTASAGTVSVPVSVVAGSEIDLMLTVTVGDATVCRSFRFLYLGA